MPDVILRGLVKKYDDRAALDGVDLNVRNGEYMVILGPTGAGKTTLLRVISGLESPQKGSVMIGDKDVTKKPPEERGVSYMSQTYSLFPHLPVWDNVKFSPLVRGTPPESADRLAREMLILVALLDRRDAYPKELSGGMAQRTALARALTAGSNVLLLDEPLRALDARLRIALRLSLRRLCKDLGITALHVTHDQEEALLIADRVAILDHGRIVQIGGSREVYENPANPFVAEFLGEATFFTGRVEQILEDKTVISGDGRVWGARKSQLQIGEEACLAVKSENIRIVTNVWEMENTLKARVVRRLFLGRFVGLEMKSEESKRPIKVKLKAETANGIHEGDEVWIGFDYRHAVAFPMPTGNLEKGMEVS